MRFTEKWTRQKQSVVWTNSYDGGALGGFCLRQSTDIKWNTWMSDYRAKIRAIDADEKANAAIRAYWHEVALEWDGGRGIIQLKGG